MANDNKIVMEVLGEEDSDKYLEEYERELLSSGMELVRQVDSSCAQEYGKQIYKINNLKLNESQKQN